MGNANNALEHLICLSGLTYGQSKSKNPVSELLSNSTLAVTDKQFSQQGYANFPYLHYLFKLNTAGEFLPLAIHLLSEETKQSISKDYHWVYLVSPVNLHVDMNSIVLRHEYSSTLSRENNELVSDYINQFFNSSMEDENWTLFYDKKINRILLLSKFDINYNQASASQLIGKSINNNELTKLSSQWKQTLTEIQMLLHQLPLNKELKQQGKLAINSLWFENGGNIRDSHKNSFNPLQFKQVITDDKMIASLCEQFNLNYQIINLSEKSYTINELTGNKTIVYITSLINSINLNKPELFYTIIENFKQTFTNSFVNIINKSSIHVSILSDSHRYQISRKSHLANLLHSLKLNILRKNDILRKNGTGK
ncbi:MAG: hypothetical protein HQL46_08015 [Gammaproteobacteria bacterium]|nr:hypothetical protein [Gammaproteobacteria bacterium]